MGVLAAQQRAERRRGWPKRSILKDGRRTTRRFASAPRSTCCTCSRGAASKERVGTGAMRRAGVAAGAAEHRRGVVRVRRGVALESRRKAARLRVERAYRTACDHHLAVCAPMRARYAQCEACRRRTGARDSRAQAAERLRWTRHAPDGSLMCGRRRGRAAEFAEKARVRCAAAGAKGRRRWTKAPAARWLLRCDPAPAARATETASATRWAHAGPRCGAALRARGVESATGQSTLWPKRGFPRRSPHRRGHDGRAGALCAVPRRRHGPRACWRRSAARGRRLMAVCREPPPARAGRRARRVARRSVAACSRRHHAASVQLAVWRCAGAAAPRHGVFSRRPGRRLRRASRAAARHARRGAAAAAVRAAQRRRAPAGAHRRHACASPRRRPGAGRHRPRRRALVCGAPGRACDRDQRRRRVGPPGDALGRRRGAAHHRHESPRQAAAVLGPGAAPAQRSALHPRGVGNTKRRGGFAGGGGRHTPRARARAETRFFATLCFAPPLSRAAPLSRRRT